jgi:hypothetical protein
MADNFMDSYKDDPFGDEDLALEPEALDWRDNLPDNAPVPMRIAIFFTGITKDEGARDLNVLINQLINLATTLGLNFEWGATDEMALEDVIDGSELAQAIQQGRP